MRLAYWMYQGTAHYGIGRITNSMRGVHAVFHAPQGDDYVNVIFTMLERASDFPQMTTSIVRGRDLVQGTIALPETLRAVEARLQPDLMVVCNSCSTTLLQDELQRVADSADTRAEVVVYDANPYRMQEVVAADNLFTFLVQRYAATPRPDPTPQPSVNLLGPASLGFHMRADLICLRRLLAALNLPINVVAPWSASLDDLKNLPRAWLTIAPYRELGQNAARFLEETHGIPAIYDAPIGVQPTLRWLETLITRINEVAETMGYAGEPLTMPPLTAFSLDGMSAPSSVPWFTRTADMESFSRKTAYVFGDATHTVGVVKFLADELGMEIAGAGTYLLHEAEWVREQLNGYLSTDLLVTEQFQDVATQIEQITPDLVCGTQMERHACRKLDLPAMVIAPPTHIENHLLGYYPMLGFTGADVIADRVYTTTKMGLEKHLIDMFGDAGLEYNEQTTPDSPPPVAESPPPPPPVAESPPPVSSNGHPMQPTTVTIPFTLYRLLMVLPESMRQGIHLHTAPEQTTSAPVAASTPPPPPDIAVSDELTWSVDGEAMLKKIPVFVRRKVRKNTETYARSRGYSTITADVLREAKEALGG